MGRYVLVLRHKPWEHPGLIGRALAGWEVRTLCVVDERSPTLPPASELAALVVMGGPMGALDDDAYPGLAAERALIAACVGADVPVLGVCLGMQLLAVSLGGALHSGAAREIGLGPVSLTAEGLVHPLLYPLAVEASADPLVLHWHGDCVDAPAGAVVLARSDATPVQAFSVGSAIGLQFHLEVTARHLDEWLQTPEMVGDLRPGELESLRAAAPELELNVPRALMGLRTFRPLPA